MKQFLILICIALLSACQPLTAKSATVTPWSTPIPRPSETLTPQPPQSFNPASIRTFTPASPAKCPKENPSLDFDSRKASDFSNSNLNPSQEHEQFIQNILRYLNSGGTIKSVVIGFQQYSPSFNTPLYVHDITGDIVPELIFPYGIWLDVVGCKDGKYELMFTDTYSNGSDRVSVIYITDINGNGVAETIAYFTGCLGNRCPTIRIYEWDRKTFQNLIANANSTNECGSLAVAPFAIQIGDIDDNGTVDIGLANNGYPQPDNDFPYRQETRTCVWNGQNIVLHKSEFDAPYYQFQAVQDGDRASLSSDYDKALSFYQQAVYDKNLQWFTQERKWYDFWIYHSKYFPSFKEPTPTASPSMVQDPNEYPVLAAYSYYRIMLVYVLQNNSTKAESTFSTLQSKFPTGSPGNYFTQVGSIFWQEYHPSMNIENSCLKVVEYARQHPLPTEYLGDWDHGVHSIIYTPESICPFK